MHPTHLPDPTPEPFYNTANPSFVKAVAEGTTASRTGAQWVRSSPTRLQVHAAGMLAAWGANIRAPSGQAPASQCRPARPRPPLAAARQPRPAGTHMAALHVPAWRDLQPSRTAWLQTLQRMQGLHTHTPGSTRAKHDAADSRGDLRTHAIVPETGFETSTPSTMQARERGRHTRSLSLPLEHPYCVE